MCRKVVFSGKCPRCFDRFIWHELTQELSCLEAKNNGVFGMCSEGTAIDEKPHDQECEACLAELEADEGYDGGMDEITEGAVWLDNNKVAADQDEGSGKHKNKKQRTS
ncbi:uncharacterized protein CTHT_0000700 [Thermochaetoides thermophila DSM 1495]|uniref:Uncharacterized protein n=1 Tax=Chaetomium thermophilum (strain DSM 1495 / CBS 144.50 / IMI 039719) TaxID=759272 RepID=G0RYV4_CHATD|nr:hypothetical protein CTHT_0000700 [Thermochaetoides thermophila DSM 1495]EGS23382.1 hypothetical protein CTHT_0000700 [Thermochaetoides thermophila DSM 1495]